MNGFSWGLELDIQIFNGIFYLQELVVKNPPSNAGDIRDLGSIPGSGRSPGEGNGNPLKYSGLGNPSVRGAWQGNNSSD